MKNTVLITKASKKSIGLYTIDDVRRVNSMQVKCYNTASGTWHIKQIGSKLYTAAELNRAWKSVRK